MKKRNLASIRFMTIGFVVLMTQCTMVAATDSGTLQIQIDRAATGDVIEIPPGEFTWTNTVRIPSNKKVIIKGAGPDNTVITSGVAGTLIDLGTSGSRVTNIGFIVTSDAGSSHVIQVQGYNWRIDHCRFTNVSGAIIEAIIAGNRSPDTPHAMGLIDHNEFVDTRLLVIGNFDLYANHVWNEPLHLGTDRNVFIQDNVFTYGIFSNAIDSDFGGCYVFRRNSVTDAYIEAHSARDNYRGAKSWEVYNNDVYASAPGKIYMPFRFRGGTGVCYDNRIHGYFDDPNIGLDNMRSYSYNGQPPDADGNDPWDGNENPAVTGAWPARDQIGRGRDNWKHTGPNSPDAVLPTQQGEPAYAWNNIRAEDSTPVLFKVLTQGSPLSTLHLQEGRDFFNAEKGGYVPFDDVHPLEILATMEGIGVVQ